MDASHFTLVTDQVPWITHLDLKCFSRSRSCNGTSVIIGQHYNWHPAQLRVERGLAGTVEAVAVDQPVNPHSLNLGADKGSHHGPYLGLRHDQQRFLAGATRMQPPLAVTAHELAHQHIAMHHGDHDPARCWVFRPAQPWFRTQG